MTVRRVAGRATTLSVVLAGAAASSPWWHRRPRTVDAVSQALAPWAALSGLPLAAISSVTRQRRTTAAALVLGASGVAMRRWLRGSHDVVPSAGAGEVVRVAHFNVWSINPGPRQAAETLAGVDCDALVLSEVTASLLRCFDDTSLAHSHPHRIDRPRAGSHGMAIWSRHPLRELPGRSIAHERIRAIVHHPAGDVVVDAIHTQSPVVHPGEWADDLHVLSVDPAPSVPAVMVGDFNAAWTHPPFRRLVARGWRNAHRARARGTSHSWRADRRWMPAFVRLDHALVNDALHVVDIDDVELPGSDHRGFVVSVAHRAS